MSVNWALLGPIVVAILALLGIVIKVVADRQTARANAQLKFLQSVLTEVQSLRQAEQLSESRVTQILGELRAMQDKVQAAQVDILACYRERNELSARVVLLEGQLTLLQRRHAKE